jgi:hypothetical protein
MNNIQEAGKIVRLLSYFPQKLVYLNRGSVKPNDAFLLFTSGVQVTASKLHSPFPVLSF